MTCRTLLAFALLAALAACGKKAEDAAATQTSAPAEQPAAEQPAATPAAAETTPAAPAEDTPEAREMARKQAALDYSTMEDSYINDAKGQWASSAKASSSFGDADKDDPNSQSSSTPWQATGKPNSAGWNNNSQDVGFDWLELNYDRPVKATEVRVVNLSSEAVESINKIELIDTEGKAHTVWSGLSDAKADERGERTWFVRKFEATPYQTKGVKLTFANNVATGYKEVDAVQLVGE